MLDVWHGALSHNFLRFRFNALHNFYWPDLQQRSSMRVVSALTKTYLCETSFRAKANRIKEQRKSWRHQVIVCAQEIAQLKRQGDTWVKWRVRYKTFQHTRETCLFRYIILPGSAALCTALALCYFLCRKQYFMNKPVLCCFSVVFSHMLSNNASHH